MKVPEVTAQLLNRRVEEYNRTVFIEEDPIQIPHLFSRSENIEISGFLTATIAWGQRKTIIASAKLLMHLMDNDPVGFTKNAGKEDLKVLNYFKHRTFCPEDCVLFIRSLQHIYRNHGGLKGIFYKSYQQTGCIRKTLIDFRRYFFEIPHLPRSEKHIADIGRGASGKKLNMFLRWMVRRDKNGVDFGLWDRINPADLYIPLDVHTGTIARELGLLKRKQNDWQAVEELTAVLRQLDPADPVKYDYALFGMGINENLEYVKRLFPV